MAIALSRIGLSDLAALLATPVIPQNRPRVTSNNSQQSNQPRSNSIFSITPAKIATLGTTLMAAADQGTARVIGFIAALLTAGAEVYGQNVIQSRLNNDSTKEAQTTPPSPPCNSEVLDAIASKRFGSREQRQEREERAVGLRRAG